jgi:putative transposase
VPHTDHRDPVQVRRSYKFMLRPTSRQATALAACLEDHRHLYNAALEERREAWRMRRVPVSYYVQAMQLPEVRAADHGGQGRWSAGSQQQTLRRLDRAFAAFFRRVRAVGRPGYPRFKGRGRFDSVEWPARKNGARWDSVPHPTVTRVYLLGIGHVRVHHHRPVQGRIKTISVKREGKRWYVVLSCDDVPARPLPATGAVTGIDMGLASFLTTSEGVRMPNPRHLAASAGRLARAQRALARKKRGSNRYRNAAWRVTSLHARVRRTRLDHAHKMALKLIRDHDLIACESLRVGNMTRRPTPRLAEDGTNEPNGASAKAGLNRSILDAGWGVFLNVLRAKAEWAGRVVVEVDPRHTSQRCSQCGYIAAGNRVAQAQFRCLSCGHEAHADVNAAVNILRAGLARQAAEAA